MDSPVSFFVSYSSLLTVKGVDLAIAREIRNTDDLGHWLISYVQLPNYNASRSDLEIARDGFPS